MYEIAIQWVARENNPSAALALYRAAISHSGEVNPKCLEALGAAYLAANDLEGLFKFVVDERGQTRDWKQLLSSCKLWRSTKAARQIYRYFTDAGIDTSSWRETLLECFMAPATLDDSDFEFAHKLASTMHHEGEFPAQTFANVCLACPITSIQLLAESTSNLPAHPIPTRAGITTVQGWLKSSKVLMNCSPKDT